MAEPVRVRRLTDLEGQKLQQIVRRGSTIFGALPARDNAAGLGGRETGFR